MKEKHKQPFSATLKFNDEEELNDFKGLIYLLKKNLTIEKIEKKRQIYEQINQFGDNKTAYKDGEWVDYNDEEDKYRDDSPKDHEGGLKAYEHYHDRTKPWLKLLAKIADNFYIRSLDKSKTDNPSEIHPAGEEKFNVADYKSDDDYDTLFDFLTSGEKKNKKILKILTRTELEQLVCFILYAGKKQFKISHENADDFYFAAQQVIDTLELPIELSTLFLGNSLFGFRQEENTTYNDKLSHPDAYLLAYRIYDRAKFIFPKLSYLEENGKKNDNQLKLVVGLVLSFVGLKDGKKISTWDEHIDKGKNQKYRKYLEDNIPRWVENGRSLAPDYLDKLISEEE